MAPSHLQLLTSPVLIASCPVLLPQSLETDEHLAAGATVRYESSQAVLTGVHVVAGVSPHVAAQLLLC